MVENRYMTTKKSKGTAIINGAITEATFISARKSYRKNFVQIKRSGLNHLASLRIGINEWRILMLLLSYYDPTISPGEIVKPPIAAIAKDLGLHANVTYVSFRKLLDRELIFQEANDQGVITIAFNTMLVY